MSDTNAGWHPDPTGKHDHRYWDGSQWTEHIADAGVSGTDPIDAVAPVETAAVDEEPTLVEEPAVEEAAPVEEPAPVEDVVPVEEPTLVEEAAPFEETAPVEETVLGDEPAAFEEPALLDEPVVEPVPPADATATYPAIGEDPAVWPTAETPYAAPAPPPPYVPADADADSSNGDSKKPLLIGGGILLAIALVVLAFLAFGGDDDDSPSTPDPLSDTSDSTTDAGSDGSDGTTPSSDGGEGSYGSDPELDDLYDACADGDFAACDQLYLDSPADSEYETFGDTCGDRNEPSGYCVNLYPDGVEDTGGSGGTDGTTLPDDFEESMADTFESSLGIDRDQAECLAQKSVEAIEEGTLDEAEAASGFLSFLSDCDISMEEIGGN